MPGPNRRLRLVRVLEVALLGLLANLATGQGVVAPRYPVSEKDIANALNAIGLDVPVSQVHLPLHMNAAIASPKLEIITAEATGKDQVRLELRCQVVLECLPFFAIMDAGDPSLIAADVRSKTGPALAASHQAPLQTGPGPANGPQLKVGSRAVLEIRDGHMVIHLQVLAMDAGTIGRQVRVCTWDRKKVFHVTVTGEDTVTGVIE